MKKFHIAVQKAINSSWLYDNYECIKHEYYKQTMIFISYHIKQSSYFKHINN